MKLLHLQKYFNMSTLSVRKIAIAAAMLAGIIFVRAADLKIMSYNIRNGIGIDGTADLDRIAEVIVSARPDIVAVQEVDSVTRRSDGRDVIDYLAEKTSMRPYYSAAIDFDGGRYGIGMLCDSEPDSIRRIALPGSEEARTAIIAVWPDKAIACTHLSLTEKDRDKGAEIVARKLAELSANGRATFMAGDFNADYDDPLFQILDERYGLKRQYPQTPTFPSDLPTEMIDHILTGGGCDTTLSGIEVLNSQASDHRPLIATFSIEAGNK